MTGPDETRTAGRISILAPEVVAKIAAGEVILRPFSVAKELLENAIDASARRIEIEIRGAADRYLSCSDDGCGMSEAESGLAIERHATSKLADETDLLSVTTLGFRGEALASIARVSRLTILSCPEGGAGTERVVRGGHLERVRPAARGRGTTVTVEDLFFNSPVRKRFLRSPAGEVRLIQRMMAAYSLAHPKVDFRFVVDEREVLHYTTAEAPERLEQVYGTRFGEKVLPLEGEHPRIRVRGWIGIPEIARATTAGQTMIVNGRWVSHPALGHALRQGFGDLLPAGRQPFAVLILDVVGGSVDVNVHPTKREIRFLDESLVFAEVVRIVRQTTHGYAPSLIDRGGRWGAGGVVGEEQGSPPYLTGLDPGSCAAGPNAAAGQGGVPAGPDEVDPAGVPMVPLWQIAERYIVAQTRQGILIVDQHAAHERILYERALQWLSGEPATSQQLLFPVVVQLEPGEARVLESCAAELPRLGIDFEPFGGDAVVLRAVPATWEGDPATMLTDLLDDIAERTRLYEERRTALAASFACRAAIRSGARLDLPAMNRLIDELYATSLPHGDPHGRPTLIVLSVEELDRRFGRSG